MSEFRFKQFSVKNDDSPMKVGTDGVLLGAATTVTGDEKQILDIGTGTGVIALMLAQRTESAQITGIDIDLAAYLEAKLNFEHSPWKDRLTAIHSSLNALNADSTLFDLIVSNPPYFDDSLKNPDARRSEARHSVSLSYKELLLFASAHLKENGRLAMILPADVRGSLLREGRSRSMFANRILNIQTTARKVPSRIIVEFSRLRPEQIKEENLVIHDRNQYSKEYRELTEDFYLDQTFSSKAQDFNPASKQP